MELSDKIVLVRVDFNVPICEGTVADDSRLIMPVDTVKNLQSKGAKVVLMSHLGKTSEKNQEQSLGQLIPCIESIYGSPVVFLENYLQEDARRKIEETPQNSLILLENLRFHPEEENCDQNFAKRLASLGDFFVNEAFPVSHRKHASVFGIPQFLPSELGENFKKEIQTIEKFFNNSDQKTMAIIGGSKLSTKVKLLKRLVTKVNKLALGGGIAGAFLPYFGNHMLQISDSQDYSEDVKEIAETAKDCRCELVVPTDFSALISSKRDEHTIIKSGNSNTGIFDIGPDSVELLKNHISDSDMVLWNGPVGLFEKSPFEFGTKAIAEFIAERTQNHGLISVIGGGDTGYAMKKFNTADKMTYISTAGGAFLNYIENGTCPALEALETCCFKEVNI